MILWLLGAAALAVVGLSVAIRLAPHDPKLWHVEPLAAGRAGGLNSFFVAPDGAVADRASPVYALDAAALAVALDDYVMSQPRTFRLAGGPEIGWTTYVQRSLLMGYPDYVSVRAIDLGDGKSALAIYSRSRFGKGDLGVNRGRLTDWLEALEPLAE